MKDDLVERLALALAEEDGRQQGNRYAATAYRAGVDMTIEYWDALARAALTTTEGLSPDRGVEG